MTNLNSIAFENNFKLLIANDADEISFETVLILMQ